MTVQYRCLILQYNVIFRFYRLTSYWLPAITVDGIAMTAAYVYAHRIRDLRAIDDRTRAVVWQFRRSRYPISSVIYYNIISI